MNHSANDLIMLFNDLFRDDYQTELVRGDREPEYLPASDEQNRARIVFAHGYFASALHEISHWCIAGQRRRALVDYGYWYCPDGRTPEQQRAFERVEVRPQALEWLFSVAAGSRFHISVDNLSGDGACDESGFHWSVWRQADRYLQKGLPERAGRFLEALKTFYGTTGTFDVVWRREAERLPGPAPGPDEKVNRTL
ncbi:MAG TPA: transporting ATPase [Marinobacter sp.]|nr:transporting ATPase [Marinobacter sp.]